MFSITVGGWDEPINRCEHEKPSAATDCDVLFLVRIRVAVPRICFRLVNYNLYRTIALSNVGPSIPAPPVYE